MSQEPATGAYVLVIEDNPANQMLIQFTLAASGFEVAVAGSAQEALESMARRAPQLILMDIQLPGQDGLSLTRQLKADPRFMAIPIVALTARAMAGDRELTLEAGCAGYIAKPINTRTIAGEIRAYLEA